MNTIEETYCIINKQSGQDMGLLVLNSRIDARGGIATDMQIMPLGALIEGGDYRLEFVKRLAVDRTTRRRFAPCLVANNNRAGV